MTLDTLLEELVVHLLLQGCKALERLKRLRSGGKHRDASVAFIAAFAQHLEFLQLIGHGGDESAAQVEM